MTYWCKVRTAAQLYSIGRLPAHMLRWCKACCTFAQQRFFRALWLNNGRNSLAQVKETSVRNTGTLEVLLVPLKLQLLTRADMRMVADPKRVDEDDEERNEAAPSMHAVSWLNTKPPQRPTESVSCLLSRFPSACKKRKDATLAIQYWHAPSRYA